MSIAEAIFKAADVSGSGTTPADSLIAQFKKMDTSGTGSLSLQEWLDGLHQVDFSDDDRAKGAFSELDKSGDGVTLASLNAIVHEATHGGAVTEADFLEATKKAVA